MNLILVTACPAGTATTFLAARALERAAEQRNWNATLEMHSQLAPVVPLSSQAIKAAELVIVASTVPVDMTRFVGKRVFHGTPAEAIPDPGAFLDRAERDAETLTEEAARALDKQGLQATQPSEEDFTDPARSGKRIVAVTACPTGVAHTFMAAEALAEAAKNAGYSMRVETQGSVGAQDALSETEIQEADLVILAADIEVDATRFAGKPIWRTSTGNALKRPAQTLQDGLEKARVETGADGAGEKAAPANQSPGPYRHLLTGVSFMLPMVVAGGLLIALSFVFGINAAQEEGSLAAALMEIGANAAFQLMVPLLAGYIAYSIADRPGIAPGMIGGYLASTIGAGFLGGIVAGFLAGYVARALSRHLPLAASIESLKPILLIPLVASLVTGLTMIYVVGQPVANIMAGLTDFLASMNAGNAILLGGLLGAMMCFDLGGPVNKAAYTFGVGLMSQGAGAYAPMAAIMAAGMVPAIGMGVASVLASGKFSQPERQAGKASFVLGLCFISEGAIPFMAKDPLRVIPICMVGGALTGALSMYFGIQLMAPHGGLFVLLIPNAVSQVVLYLLAISAGALVIGGLYAALKKGQAPVAVGPAT